KAGLVFPSSSGAQSNASCCPPGIRAEIHSCRKLQKTHGMLRTRRWLAAQEFRRGTGRFVRHSALSIPAVDRPASPRNRRSLLNWYAPLPPGRTTSQMQLSPQPAVFWNFDRSSAGVYDPTADLRLTRQPSRDLATVPVQVRQAGLWTILQLSRCDVQDRP